MNELVYLTGESPRSSPSGDHDVGKQYKELRLDCDVHVERIRVPKGILSKTRIAEVHWYEAHGIGKKKMKIKMFLDEST